MKRNFLFLIGFFVIALSAAIFAACEKDSSKSGDNSALVGKWKYVDEYMSQYVDGGECYVYITFNEDGTGTIRERSYYAGDIDIKTTFEYSYDEKKEILKIDVDDVNSYYYSVFGYTGYYSDYSKYKVDWVGDNRFYLIEMFYGNYYYDDYKIGPFIRQ